MLKELRKPVTKKMAKFSKPRILFSSTHILAHRVAHPMLILLEQPLQVRAVLCTSPAATFVTGVVYTCHPGGACLGISATDGALHNALSDFFGDAEGPPAPPASAIGLNSA